MSLKIKQNLGKGLPPLGLPKGKVIDHLDLRIGEPTRISFSDGTAAPSSCLHCPDQPCVKYKAEEGSLALANQFRIDAAPQVCATDAIRWDYEKSQPEID